jgi:hypothetical protein
MKRVVEIRRGKHETKPGETAGDEDMFRAITIAIEAAREVRQGATDELLSYGKTMQARLERALQRGKYRQ